MSKITAKEIKEEIYSVPIPKNWRQGQVVFNRVEDLYGGVARLVQFKDHVDCFYNDDAIDNFIDKVCIRLNNV